MTPSFTVSLDRPRRRILTGLSKEASVRLRERAAEDGRPEAHCDAVALCGDTSTDLRIAPGYYKALGRG